MKYALLILLIAILFINACQIENNNGPKTEINITEKKTNESSANLSIIRITRIPSTAEGRIPVTWTVNYDRPVNASQVGIYFDKVSHPINPADNIKASKSGYQFFSETTKEQFAIPATFHTFINIPKDMSSVYLRAHALINGKDYWTEEFEVKSSK